MAKTIASGYLGVKDIDKDMFEFIRCKTVEEVMWHIRLCEGSHQQQVAYSSYHNAMTQVCFTCKKIRTNIEIKGG